MLNDEVMQKAYEAASDAGVLRYYAPDGSEVSEADAYKLLSEKNKLRKNTQLNLRISSETLALIKRRAQKEGMPYQTLIGSVLHKFAHGEL